MKLLKYRLMTETNHGTEENPQIEQVFNDGSRMTSDEHFEENLAITRTIAYNGEVTVDEVPDPEPTPSNNLETRVSAVEHDVADLTAAVEKGLSL